MEARLAMMSRHRNLVLVLLEEQLGGHRVSLKFLA